MREAATCKESIEACRKSGRFSVAYLYDEEKPMELHLHDCCEIYFSISGGRQFLIGDRRYDINPGDVFMIGENESHFIVRLEDQLHERIVISVMPQFIERISSEETHLLDCFWLRGGGFSPRVHLNREEAQRFVYLSHKITGTQGAGADLIENSALTELLVLLYSHFVQGEQDGAAPAYCYNELVSGILRYVNENLSDGISTSQVAGHFHVSEAHLCRLFKAETGTTVYKYITARRLSTAKAMLAAGYTVAEACEKSGFSDYTGFVQTFARTVGVTPKKYSMMNRQ